MGTLSQAERNALLDTFAGSAVWVKLHTGDPGAAGTSNAAGETTRKQATFAAAASGAITNSSLIEWPTVSTTETVTHVSLWSASSGGTFRGSDDLNSAAPLTAGDTLRIPAGDLDVTLT